MAAPPAVPALTLADIDTIVEAIDCFVIGPVEDAELRAIWQPYIDKLQALKAQQLFATCPRCGYQSPVASQEDLRERAQG